jgi:hypothetical protein
LKRLDSDKEIKVNATAVLWPGLAGFGSIWLDLAKFGFGLDGSVAGSSNLHMQDEY